MESQSVFQAETHAKKFSIELPPCLFEITFSFTMVSADDNDNDGRRMRIMAMCDQLMPGTISRCQPS